jgi:hypothetical protein
MDKLIRPRYTIAHPNELFIQRHYESFPFAIGKEMLWDERTKSFPELKTFMRKPHRVAIVVDHETGQLGAIFQVNKTNLKAFYYWLMYGRDRDAKGNPHIRLCHWIKPNEGVL